MKILHFFPFKKLCITFCVIFKYKIPILNVQNQFKSFLLKISENPLAALLQLSQQQTSGKSSPIESLAAALKEKENRLNQLTEELKDLEDEFQTNYDFIIKRDAKIEELKGEINAKDSEYQFIISRTKQAQDEMNMASERVTICQKKIDELMKNKSLIDKEITQIQFNATRLKETKVPIMQVSESKESLGKLNLTLSDLLKRKDMVFNIVNDIYRQSELSLSEAKSKYQREIDIIHMKLQEQENSHKELVNAVHLVEQQMHDESNRIELQKQEIANQYDPDVDSKIQISQMKKVIFEIDKEIETLKSDQKQNLEADQQRQEFYQTQAQRLNKISKDRQEKISNYQIAINTQKMEIKKLQNRLESQMQKNEELANGIEQIQCGYQKPNFQQLLLEEKEKLNQKFATCTKKQLKAHQKLKDQQQCLDDQIEKQKQIINRLVEGINQIVIESRKRSEIVTRERKKSKLLSLEIKSCEGELDALTNGKNDDESPIKLPLPDLPDIPDIPGVTSDNSSHLISRPVAPPPPLQIPSSIVPSEKLNSKQKKMPKKNSSSKNDDSLKIQQLTAQLDQLTEKMNNARIEMKQLTEKENNLKKEIIRLRIENKNLQKETANYDEIKKYYVSLSKTGKFEMLKANKPPNKK